MWFETLTGFEEKSPEQVRAKLEVNGRVIKSLVNGKSYHFGRLSIPSLAELRESSKLASFNDRIKVSEVVGDVQLFHLDQSNTGALFQAASQFNLLEMVGPYVTPEEGVGIYENDRTQGPACAIACGAGTIYRNYFARVNGQTGQSENHQIGCLKDLGNALKQEGKIPWNMRNGYALATREELKSISEQIGRSAPEAYESLKGLLRIGIQWDTEVTIGAFLRT